MIIRPANTVYCGFFRTAAMVFKYAFTLPTICITLFLTTILTTYAISVWRKDVKPIFPYISDTGTWSPESCVFGIMLNLGALLQGLIIYVRYRQVDHLLQTEVFQANVRKHNKISFIIGIIAAFGVCLVGNFQETNVLSLHLLGAFGAFGLGTLYIFLQAYLSFSLYPIFGFRTINIARVVCSIACAILLVLVLVCAGLSFPKFKGSDLTKWSKNDGGYLFHLLSSGAEWLLVLTIMIFLMLFTKEFRNVTISAPVIKEVP